MSLRLRLLPVGLMCGLLLTGCGEKLEPHGFGDSDTLLNGMTTFPETDSETNPGTDTGTDLGIADTGTSTDATYSFTVLEGGDVAAGDWRGHAEVRVAGDGSTISPENFSALAENGSLCVEGVVSQMDDWSGFGLLYMNVAETADQSNNAWTPADVESEAIYLDVTNPGQTELRVLIESDTNNWCAVLDLEEGTFIPFSDFNTKCWNNSGKYYGGEPLRRAGVLVPGLNSEDRPYSYCIREMYPVTEFEPILDTDVDTGAPIDTSQIPADWHKGYVAQTGMLQAKDASLYAQGGTGAETVLRGMSLFWSHWGGDYFTKETVDWLVSDWQVNVIRAPLSISGQRSGYLGDPTTEMQKVTTVVNAAIEAGIYVIIDWHAHEADKNPYDARAFFEVMAQTYGQFPNVIYEIWNEPLDFHDWNDDILPYAEFVIEGIRAHDPDNLILVGTPTWSQEVLQPVNDEVNDPNVAYVLHFYVGQHDFYTLTKSTEVARSHGLTVFVSEWGVWDGGYIPPADTDDDSWHGEVDTEQLNKWLTWADEQKLSMCMWSTFDKDEPSAILRPGASTTGNWTPEELTTVGIHMRDVFRGYSF